ncbi:MAG TPA: hypothetical protein VJ203_06430 [Bacteroidales bacterium]|nr:hypothetical protein [Bacteroidales bacterium]
MKKPATNLRIRNLFFMAVLFLSGSCLDYTVKTSVNRDGTIFRQYTIRGDSADIFNGSLMIPAGDRWQIDHVYDHKEKDDSTSEKSQYVYTASRKFENVAALNDWLTSDTSTGTVKVKINLKKRFQWFYTYYDYKEVFPMSFPFVKLPVDSFLSGLEQSVILDDDKTVYSPADRNFIWKRDTITYRYSPDDSMEMKRISNQCEEKLWRWMTASFIEEFISLLESDFAENPATRDIRQKSDQFVEVVFNKVKLMSEDSINVQVLVSTGDSLLQSDGLKMLYAANPAGFAFINDKINHLDFLENDDDYYQSLTMPGTVFSTNAGEVRETLLIWDFEPGSFLMKDYVMSASSRVANPGIMVVTAITAIFLLAILIMKRKRQPAVMG